MDSEDELQELLGEDAEDDWESDDSEAEEMLRFMDGKGNDLDLINDGFIVPDDYFSDES